MGGLYCLSMVKKNRWGLYCQDNIEYVKVNSLPKQDGWIWNLELITMFEQGAPIK